MHFKFHFKIQLVLILLGLRSPSKNINIQYCSPTSSSSTSKRLSSQSAKNNGNNNANNNANNIPKTAKSMPNIITRPQPQKEENSWLKLSTWLKLVSVSESPNGMPLSCPSPLLSLSLSWFY